MYNNYLKHELTTALLGVTFCPSLTKLGENNTVSKSIIIVLHGVKIITSTRKLNVHVKARLASAEN